jgi:hypothetical protein
MGNFSDMGRWLMLAGIAIVVVGGVLWLLGKIPWGGSDLPGTIRIEGSGFSCVFPVLASIVLSLVLTIVLNVIVRLFHK